MKFLNFTISILSVLCAQGSALAISSDIDNGLKHMKAKSYESASRFFYKAARANPDDAIARYHLANSYVHLNKHDHAMKEYRASLELDPYSIVSGYCKKALIAYKTALPASVSAGSSSNGVSTSKQHSNAVNMIRRQLANEKNRHHQYASSLSENVKKAGDVRIDEIKKTANHKIQMLLDYGALVDTGRGFKRTGKAYSTLNNLEKREIDRAIAEIRRQAEEDVKKEKRVANKRSTTIDKWSENRKDSLDSVAENLENQFEHKTSPSGIRLNPVGTGLYVRNYKSVKKRPLPDARYSIARFVDSLDQEKNKPNVEEKYQSQSSDKNDTNEQENVKGSIIVNLIEPIK